jgi:HlyD family secretion protein
VSNVSIGLAPLARAAGTAWARLRVRPFVWFVVFSCAAIAGLGMRWTRVFDDALTVSVRRGTLAVHLTEAGRLRPAELMTYRSPVSGREAEIMFLAAEGTRVNEGDLIVKLDPTGSAQELARARQDLRQAEVDLQLAEVERQEGLAAVQSAREGEGALSVDEAQTRLKIAERKAARLKQEFEGLKQLKSRGFLTGEELEKSGFELEQAEADLALAQRKAAITRDQTQPRERTRATLQLAQKEAARENVRARLAEARVRVKTLEQELEGCQIYARSPGLVVYEDFLGAGARRKVRVGDRVTASQGIVTIPGLDRMLVESSVREAEVHRVRPGQPVSVRVEAFPDVTLTGAITHVGTLARSVDEAAQDKRFELTITLDPSGVDLRPAMTARVEILVGEKHDVLLLPISAVFDRQGGSVCRVVGMFGVDTRAVELGESDDVFVEIRTGLREGERVALLDGGSGTTPRAPAPPAQSMRSRLSGAGAPALTPLAPR